MELVESMPSRSRKAQRYPWNEWFIAAKKMVVKLDQGVDFNTSPQSMVNGIRQAANRRGLLVQVVIIGESIYMRL